MLSPKVHPAPRVAPACRAGGALLLVLALAGSATAGPVSFPIALDPTIPNAWVVAAYVHQCGGCKPDEGDESSYLDGPPVANAGFYDLVTGGGGAFSALDFGALGVESYGFSDGGGTGSHAYLIVNVPLSGSGTNTVKFEIQGSEFVEASNAFSSDNTFIANLSYQVLDASTHAVLGSGGANAYECDPVGICNRDALAFPIDLSASFSIDQPSLVQLSFGLFSESEGFAGALASHTGLITLDLAPGVTMDASSGFLSTPGDPDLVPEPSRAALLLTSGVLLAAFARPRRFDRRAARPSAAETRVECGEHEERRELASRTGQAEAVSPRAPAGGARALALASRA